MALEGEPQLNHEREEQERFVLEKSRVKQISDLRLLTKLNLPACNLASLPSELPRIVPNLSILFCPQNKFKELPAIIGECPNLQMVSFKDNGMETIHPEALQPQMRWLILTGNHIKSIPESIGRCKRLQKLMLSGNSLTALPKAISELTCLELIRLACNEIQEVFSSTV
jgi:Leucine-rich repeat (LRR) protein